MAVASHSPPRGPGRPTSLQSRARPRRGGSRTSTSAGPPRPRPLPPRGPARCPSTSSAPRARNSAQEPAGASPWAPRPGSTRRALAAKAAALPGFRSVLSRRTPQEPGQAAAACARLRPMAPTPPQSSSSRSGSGSAGEAALPGPRPSTRGARRPSAAFMSRRTCSNTGRFACWKLAGPKENSNPSSVSNTSGAASASDTLGRTCCQAPGFFEWMALCKVKSGSRQCTHTECHRRAASSAPKGQSAAIS
mmetsp:Transcript_56729/g.171737  ORF Transcript_56729/g.171737 Transcript_56729/m.171737 type:complete len:249 (-) Transcript_56729:532-1278(-)